MGKVDFGLPPLPITEDQVKALSAASGANAENRFALLSDVGGGGGGATGQPNFSWSNETNYGYNNVWGFEYGIVGTLNPVWIIADVDTYTPYISMFADGATGPITYGSSGITFPDGSFQSTATTGTSDQTLSSTDTVRFANLRIGVDLGTYEILYSNDGIYFFSGGTLINAIYGSGATFTNGTYTASYASGGITFPDGSFQSTAASGGGGGSPTVVNLVGTGTTYSAVVGDRIFLVDGGMAIDLTWLYTEPVGIEITVVNQDASTAATVASAYSGVYGSNSIAPQTAAKFITGANGWWHRVQ